MLLTPASNNSILSVAYCQRALWCVAQADSVPDAIDRLLLLGSKIAWLDPEGIGLLKHLKWYIRFDDASIAL